MGTERETVLLNDLVHGGTEMRKKSHISLAKYIVRNTSDEDLKKHRWSFYFGSILPDCKPSFLYRKHEINETFPDVKRTIDQLIYGKKNKPVKNKRKYYMNLGQITHYVADYFTFPHNNIYPGGLREHCAYEEELKHRLREYLKNGKIQAVGSEMEFDDTEELYEYILNKHETYLERKLNVEEDIRHIVSVNRHLVEGISHLFQKTKSKQGFSNS